MFDKLFHHSEKHTDKHKMLKYFCKQRGCSFEQDAEIPPPIDCPVCNNPAHFEVEEIVENVDADNKNNNENKNSNAEENEQEKNI